MYELCWNISGAGVSESAVESVEDSFNKSDRPLPEPPLGRRRVALGSLLTVGISALLVAYLLLPNALYAMRRGEPENLGPLASASLESAALTNAGSWVSATGTPDPTALRFSRFGARGSFRLTQVKERNDVWLLFQVPSSAKVEFVPPTHVVGRLRRFSDTGLLPSQVRDKIASGLNQSADEFLLVDGESPASQRPSLFAAILLSLLAAACLSSAFFLWRDVK